MAENWIQKVEKKSVSFDLQGMEKKSIDNTQNIDELKPKIAEPLVHIRASEYSENISELNAKPSAKKEILDNQGVNNG